MHPLLTAGTIVRSSTGDWYFFPIAIAIGMAGLVPRYWRFFGQWLKGTRGKDWGTIQAVIDVVSVTVQTESTRSGERTIGYLATLTYFYHNPDLQMGEYCRMFDDEGTANGWAKSLKGRQVMAHVDPRDPSNSVLRKEEVDAATYPLQTSA